MIGIPLDAQHDDARLDLQEILDHIYDTTGYEFYIYCNELDRPADVDIADWLRQFVPASSRH